MNKKIEVEQFDKCVLLQFGELILNKTLRRVKTSDGLEFAVIDYVEMNAEDGIEIVKIINALPYEEQSRCHSPLFGLELLKDENQVFVCSICWKCNNLFFMNNQISSFLGFDAKSKEAKLLFNKFKIAFNAIIDLEDT